MMYNSAIHEIIGKCVLTHGPKTKISSPPPPTTTTITTTSTHLDRNVSEPMCVEHVGMFLEQ